MENSYCKDNLKWIQHRISHSLRYLFQNIIDCNLGYITIKKLRIIFTNIAGETATGHANSKRSLHMNKVFV